MSNDRPPTLPGLEELAPPEELGNPPPGAPPSVIVRYVRGQVARENRERGPRLDGHKPISDGVRRTRERAALIEAGWHPLTKLPLLVGTGETCGDCVHQYGGRYHKCDLMENTRGPGTDLRVGWPACQRYERSDR